MHIMFGKKSAKLGFPFDTSHGDLLKKINKWFKNKLCAEINVTTISRKTADQFTHLEKQWSE